ncbi:hypothetical protein M407DRAFT_26902 [Tulasnella calospora MUT 4182]|uniref:Uncharacterized protein n=1 Tax=Tulasnella calospora MUT 4182 TaxID=1051891 RepID=A0A0C3QET8_9AGAM|nr:hypothetical protein M407DRAFT_26902 [Tulasnella calospora MUT 4182]
MIDTVENRFEFFRLLSKIGVDQPLWKEFPASKKLVRSARLSALLSLSSHTYVLLPKAATPESNQFYSKLWFGDDKSQPPINLHTGPQVTISEADIHRLCTVVSNNGESSRGVCSDEVVTIRGLEPSKASFSSYHNTFEIVDKKTSDVDINSPIDIAILGAKHSEYCYKNKSTYSEASVTGQISVSNQLKQLVLSAPSTIATVSLTATPSAYLKCRGTPDVISKFENGGYSLTSSKVPSAFLAPATKQAPTPFNTASFVELDVGSSFIKTNDISIIAELISRLCINPRFKIRCRLSWASQELAKD